MSSYDVPSSMQQPLPVATGAHRAASFAGGQRVAITLEGLRELDPVEDGLARAAELAAG